MTASVAADPGPLVASGNLRRRRIVSRIAEAGATASAVLAVAVLGIVVYSVVARGAGALSLDFLTTAPPRFGGAGGGIGPALLGTGLLVVIATTISMPLGVLVALYTTEFAGRRAARILRLILDVLNGMPSIVIGLFVFGLFVVGRGQRGFAGSIGLAVIMMPLIARSSQEVLRLVPQSLSDAADALGVSRWRTVRGVLIPSALGGVVTATVLAVARAAGETAPLLFTSSIYGGGYSFNFFGEAIPNIPVFIFQASEDSDPAGFTRAWGAALVLVVFILVSSLLARTLLARSLRRLRG